MLRSLTQDEHPADTAITVERMIRQLERDARDNPSRDYRHKLDLLYQWRGNLEMPCPRKAARKAVLAIDGPKAAG